MRYLPFVLLLALVVYALVDCVRHEDTGMPVGLPKAIWVVLIIVFPGAGALAWLVVSRANRQVGRTARPGQPSSSGGFPSRPTARRPAPRPVAPDDDPEFLASLDRPRPQPAPSAEEPTSQGPTSQEPTSQEPTTEGPEATTGGPTDDPSDPAGGAGGPSDEDGDPHPRR